MGVNGRCDVLGPLPGCECAYDQCSGDSACPKGETCACHDTPLASGGNQCLPSNCRVDGDCGAGGYCSPSADGGCGQLTGYYCHTPSDTCVNDSDCTAPHSCVYDRKAGHWVCKEIPLCA